MTIPYFQTSDRVVGRGHATLTDSINRALRWVITKSGLNPDDVFTGFMPVFNIKAYGAVGDGVADDRAAVQSTINAAVAAGGGRVYGPRGTYLLNSYAPGYTDRILTLNGGAGVGLRISFVGDGAILTTPLNTNVANSSTYMLYVEGNLEDPLIEGFEVRNTHGLTAGRTIAVGFFGGSTSTIQRLTVRRMTFRDHARCLQLQGVNGGLLTDNKFLFTNGRDSGSTNMADPHVAIWVQVEATFACTDIKITDSYYDGCTSGTVAANTNKNAADGMVYGRCRGWTITGNTIKRYGFEGIYVDGRQGIDAVDSVYPCVIANNVLDTLQPTGATGDTPYSIRCDENGGVVEGNTIRNSIRGGIWVSAAPAHMTGPIIGTKVQNNYIEMLDGAVGNSFVGILFEDVQDFTCQGNTVRWKTATSSGTTLDGVKFSTAVRGQISGNKVRCGTLPVGKTLNGYSFYGACSGLVMDDNVADTCTNALYGEASLSVFQGLKIGTFSFPGCTNRLSLGGGVRGFFMRSTSDVGTSANRGDTNFIAYLGIEVPVHRVTSALTANRVVTIDTSGAMHGDRGRVVRTGLGAFTLDVGGLKTIPASTAAFVDYEYDGNTGSVVLTGYGTL